MMKKPRFSSLKAIQLTLIPLFILSGLTNAVAQMDVTWLRRTAVAHPRFCAASQGPLYRGVTGEFFPLSRVIRNMVGDQSAEHPSWRFSGILSEVGTQAGSPISVDLYNRAKLIAATELDTRIGVAGRRDRRSCVFGTESAIETSRGKSEDEKWRSLGISTATSFGKAQNYAPIGGTILEITEKVPRAVPAGNQFQGEYIIPILIPAHDISRAWFPKVILQKEEVGNELNRILVFTVPMEPNDPRPGFNSERAAHVGNIIRCQDPSDCRSSSSTWNSLLRAPEFRELTQTLDQLKNSGFYFKFEVN